MYKYMLYYL